MSCVVSDKRNVALYCGLRNTYSLVRLIYNPFEYIRNISPNLVHNTVITKSYVVGAMCIFISSIQIRKKTFVFFKYMLKPQ